MVVLGTTKKKEASMCNYAITTAEDKKRIIFESKTARDKNGNPAKFAVAYCKEVVTLTHKKTGDTVAFVKTQMGKKDPTYKTVQELHFNNTKYQDGKKHTKTIETTYNDPVKRRQFKEFFARLTKGEPITNYMNV